MEAKISRVPAIASFCATFIIAVFLSAVAIAAGIYDYTFGDVFIQLDIVLILLAVAILITVIRGISNLNSLRAGLKIVDGNVEIKYFKKLKLRRAEFKLEEIKKIFCVQTIFEKIVKQGTVKISTADKKFYTVNHVKDAALLVENLTNASGDII